MGAEGLGVAGVQGERRFVGLVLRKALTVALRELDLQGGDIAGGAGDDDGIAPATPQAPSLPSLPRIPSLRPAPYTRLPRRTPAPFSGQGSRALRKRASRVGEGFARSPRQGSRHDPVNEALCYRDLEESFPRYPSADDIVLTEQQRRLWLDITPYVNQTPPTVSMHAPLTRTYALFRSLGLRHLVAVDPFNNVVGIITRHDLSEHNLSAKARAQSRQNAHKIQHMYSPRVKLSTQVHTPLSAADTRPRRSTFDTPTLI